jgi:hypothetical protein
MALSQTVSCTFVTYAKCCVRFQIEQDRLRLVQAVTLLAFFLGGAWFESQPGRFFSVSPHEHRANTRK